MFVDGAGVEPANVLGAQQPISRRFPHESLHLTDYPILHRSLPDCHNLINLKLLTYKVVGGQGLEPLNQINLTK